MVSNPVRPFYRMGENLFIGAIPRAEFQSFMLSSFQQIKGKPEPEAIIAILNLAEDVPYNIQALGRACWEEMVNTSSKILNEATVQAIHQRLVRSNAPIYAPLWNALTINQQKSLAAVASMKGEQLLTRPILKRFDISPGAMQKALQAMENNSLIRRDYQQSSGAYCFEDPFFKAWIAITTTAS